MAEPQESRRGSKAGRNEGRKLAATALNNLGVAFFLAALLQPALAFLQQERWPSLEVVIGSAIFLAVAGGFFRGAQVLVRRLED